MKLIDKDIYNKQHRELIGRHKKITTDFAVHSSSVELERPQTIYGSCWTYAGRHVK